MDALFQFTLKNKQKIILVFKVFYFLYIIFILYGIYSIITLNSQYIFFSQQSILLGELAIIFFCLAITSGILRRFRILPRVMSSLMLIRRYLGITTFLFGFGHYMLIRGSYLLSGQVPFKIGPLFELFGIAALSCLLLLFFTSNDYSVRKLGKKWTMLHKLVYVIVWFIFFHTALQAINLWSILIGTYAVLETVSLIYNHFRMEKLKAVPPKIPPVPPATFQIK